MKNQGIRITPTIIISCCLAGCLEMYDFIIFGFLASTLQKNYLSFLDENTGIMIAYLLFAVGFLFRPLGSIIFGYIGDVYGRKKAVVMSVSFMGASAVCMACLPSYQTIGVLSCWLIVLIRIIQGISVGGEYSGVTIYAIEHTTKKNMGLIGSTIVAGGLLGVILATFVSRILQYPNLPSYSWRFAFLLGFGLSIVGYFIRKRLGESPIFKKTKTDGIKIPLFYGLKKFKKQFCSAILLAGANNANFYFLIVFLPGFLKEHTETALNFNTLLLTSIMLPLIPLAGWFSDKVGRLNILIGTCLIFAVYQPILLPALMNTTSQLVMYIHTFICAVTLSLFVASTNIFVLEIFPVNCRFSCGALSYSIGTALFGGTAPFVCSFIIERYGANPSFLTSYISFMSIVGLLGVSLVYKDWTKNKKKEENEIIVLQNS